MLGTIPSSWSVSLTQGIRRQTKENKPLLEGTCIAVDNVFPKPASLKKKKMLVHSLSLKK